MDQNPGDLFTTCGASARWLFDVDYLARQLLMDVVGDDAGPLLRAWPTMVAAAEDLWPSLPGRRPGVDERDDPITRLAAQAGTIETTLAGRNGWLGDNPAHPGSAR